MEEKRKRGRPKTKLENPARAAAALTKSGEEKYIIIAKTEDIEAMKDIAYWDRLTIKQVYAQAIADRIARFQRKNGPLKPRPK